MPPQIIKTLWFQTAVYYLFIFLFFTVALVPFNIIVAYEIKGVPFHYIYIGGLTTLLVIVSFLGNPRLTVFDKWLILLAAGFSLSLIASVDRAHSARVLTGFVSKGVFIAFVAARILKTRTKDANTALILCASLVSLTGLVELFSVWNPYSDFNSGLAGGRILHSTIGNPLVFGVFLVLFVPLAVLFFREDKRLLKLVPVCLIIPSVLLSFSRISWIALFLVLIIYCRKVRITNKKSWIYGVIFATVVAAPFLFAPKFRDIAADRFNPKEVKSFSFVGRVTGYRITRDILNDYSPLFGVGFGNYPKVYPEYKIKHAADWPDLITPDNMYLRFLCDTGIVGAMTFFAFIVYWMRQLWKKRDDPVVWAIFCGLIGFLISQLTADLMLWAPTQFAFWMLMGFGAGLINEETRVPAAIQPGATT